MKEPCCITLCQLFLKKDESLQRKLPTLFQSMGMPLRPISKKHYSLINRRCFKCVYTILSSFKPQPAEEAHEPDVSMGKTVRRICKEDNLISFPANKEDFLFQLSRLFDMEESWEIETTIAAIIAFHPQLDKEDLNRMEPVFQRAATIVANGWEPYEDLLATFLLEYQRLWAQKDTSNTGILRNMFTRFGRKAERNR